MVGRREYTCNDCFDNLCTCTSASFPPHTNTATIDIRHTQYSSVVDH